MPKSRSHRLEQSALSLVDAGRGFEGNGNGLFATVVTDIFRSYDLGSALTAFCQHRPGEEVTSWEPLRK